MKRYTCCFLRNNFKSSNIFNKASSLYNCQNILKYEDKSMFLNHMDSKTVPNILGFLDKIVKFQSICNSFLLWTTWVKVSSFNQQEIVLKTQNFGDKWWYECLSIFLNNVMLTFFIQVNFKHLCGLNARHKLKPL